MNSYFDFEYYPKINPKIIERHEQIIISNRDKWGIPFFTDTTSYLDLAKIEGPVFYRYYFVFRFS